MLGLENIICLEKMAPQKMTTGVKITPLDICAFFKGKDGQTMNSDARVMFHYSYTAVTPAMTVSVPGVGSDYGIAFVDLKKRVFDET
jgi:hypothetical protein